MLPVSPVYQAQVGAKMTKLDHFVEWIALDCGDRERGRQVSCDLPPVSETRLSETIQKAAIDLLNRAGARQFILDGTFTIALWEGMDTPEIRAAISELHPGGVQVLHLEDARVPEKYRQPRHDGYHAPEDANRNNRNNLLESGGRS